MADLLTHVLVPYILLTAASWRVAWITKRWIAVGMAGAAIPDLAKVGIVVDDAVIEGLLGVPFDYTPISTLGGVLVLAGAITLLFDRERPTAFAFLLFGGASALVLDGLRVFVDGRAGFWLYPFTWWRPPTPGWYVTSDVRVLATALALSGTVFVLDRWVARQEV